MRLGPASFRLAVVAAGILAIGGAKASGEIAVMESGKILYVDRFERHDDQVTLYLTGGGVVRVPWAIVRNIVPNEIVEEAETPPQHLHLFPHLREIILPAASKYGVDANLVAAIIWAESSGDPNAVSTKGARGLMQLMPETARDLGVERIHDPGENVDGGTRYFRQLLDRHQGDLRLALAAYNAGPEAVKRHRGIPPYKETRDYVGKVMKVYGRAQGVDE